MHTIILLCINSILLILGVQSARKHHETVLLKQHENFSTALDNAQINPKYHTVHHWHKLWLSENIGPRFGEGVFEVYIILY